MIQLCKPLFRAEPTLIGWLGLSIAAIVALSPVPTVAQNQGQPAELGQADNLAENPELWLTDQRWRELRYGFSIREPRNSVAIPDPPQNDSIRWALPDGIRIRVGFARGVYETVDKHGRVVHMPARVDLLKDQLVKDLRGAVSGTVTNTRTDQVFELDQFTGIINYYAIKPDRGFGEPMLYGVALLQLDDLSVAVIRLECPPQHVTNGVSVFEAMVKSINVEPAKDVNRRINEWLSNSDSLLANLTQQDRLDAMRSDRLYRVIEANRDIGYIRIWQRYQDKAFYNQRKIENKAQGGDGRLRGIDRVELPGNAIVLQANYRGNGVQMTQLYETLDVSNSVSTYWQIKTSLGFDNDPTNARAGSWVETGVRGVALIGGKNLDHIHITREGTPPSNMVDFLLKRERDPKRRLRYPSADPRSYPSGDLVEKRFPVPKRAFLSTVDAMLMPAMLPRDAKTYAFSTYDPDYKKIDIRVIRVEPTPAGGKRVYVRPIIDHAEQVMTFDRNNELISWSFPDGRTMRKTTREELARVWGARLPD